MKKEELLKDFEGLDSKLKEFIEYKETLERRVNEVKKETESKQTELNELLNAQVNEFMEGKNLDNKKALNLKNEVEFLNERLARILEAVTDDEKLKGLAQEAYQEYLSLTPIKKQVMLSIKKRLEDLEEDYKKKVEDLQLELRLQSNLFVNKYLEDRHIIAEVLDLTRAEVLRIENDIERGLTNGQV